MSKIKKSFRIEESLAEKVEKEFSRFSEGAIKIIEKYYEPVRAEKHCEPIGVPFIPQPGIVEDGPAQLNISGYQEMILHEMFPGKTLEDLLVAMVDHLIPDIDKKGLSWLDENGNVTKEYESKFSLDDSCPQWKKNLRAMQATDRMMTKAGIKPPPPPNISYVPVKSRL